MLQHGWISKNATRSGRRQAANGVSLWGDKKILKSIVVMTAQLCEYLKPTKFYTLNR